MRDNYESSASLLKFGWFMFRKCTIFYIISTLGLYKKARAGIIKGFTGIDQENITKLQIFLLTQFLYMILIPLTEADPGP